MLLQKASRPLKNTLVKARSLGFGYVMFSPDGSEMEHLFSTFPEEWEDIGREPKEYRIVGEVSLEASNPEEAAREFVDKVQGGEIVTTVRNMNTDSVSDVHLGDLGLGNQDGTGEPAGETGQSDTGDEDKQGE